MKGVYRTIAFFAGVFLLAANVVGLFTSLRNPAIYGETRLNSTSPLLSEEQLCDRIDSLDGNSAIYVENLTNAVHAGILHYWKDEGIDKYHLRIPFYENYLLYLASFMFPDRFLKYEFTDYRRAIERGVGLCSQSAIIEAEVLSGNGIDSRIVSLSEHVVLQAEISEEDGEWWVLDPDYGVTIPYSMSDIEANPQIIRDFYSRAGYDEPTILNLIRIYQKEGNVVINGIGARPYHFKKWVVEQTSYALIWVIPLILMLPFGIRAYTRR